jgi:hypothetical protein
MISKDFYDEWMAALADYKYLILNNGTIEEKTSALEISHVSQREYLTSLLEDQKKHPDKDPMELLQVKNVNPETIGMIKRGLGITDPLNRVKYLVVEVTGYQGDNNYIYLQLELLDINGPVNYTVTGRAINTINEEIPTDWNRLDKYSPDLVTEGHGVTTGAFFEQVASNTVVRFVVELDVKTDIDFVNIVPHPLYSTPKKVSVYKSVDPLIHDHTKLCIEGCIHDGTLGCVDFVIGDVSKQIQID